MTLANKAIWIIERNLHRDLTLTELAGNCGVSRYHLAHAFGDATGLPVIQYVRGRRLSEAAQLLARGLAPDILSLALDTGYGSHEAFSRAFVSQFGVTPEAVRREKTAETLPMIKPIKAPDADGIVLAQPRFVNGPAMLVAGLAERQSFSSTQNIPAQWQRFMAFYDQIPDKASAPPLSVTTNLDDDGTFEYVCAVEISRVSKLPPGLITFQIPAQHYAVFLHREHVSRLVATYNAIWNKYQDHPPADGPTLERHLETFNPQTGLGGVEIWIPIKEPR